MSGELIHEPERIVQQLLIDTGILSDPDTSDVWPVYRTNMPDTPDDVVSVHETQGIQQGRAHVDGESVDKYGITLNIRSGSPVDGKIKGLKLRRRIDTDVVRKVVTIEASVYEVQGMHAQNLVIPLGVEQQATHRHLWSINYLVSLKMVEAGTGT